MALDNHEVVFSNGATAESLYLGKNSMLAMSSDARAELLEIFPNVAIDGFYDLHARLDIKGKKGKQLIARHIKNDVQLHAMAH